MTERLPDQLRNVTIEPFPTAAAGSVLITQGRTRVLCTASVEEQVPRWLIDPATGEAGRGWVTAEYNMLPGSTPERQRRGTSSRDTEIKRLIGRSLRAGVDLEKMPGLMIVCDCDVLYADGGTRTASITGAYVALCQALATARRQGRLTGDPLIGPVAAVSVGIVGRVCRLDLDYPLDSRAEVDMNVVMNAAGAFIEVQGTGEQGTFTRSELDELLELASGGIRQLIGKQETAIAALPAAPAEGPDAVN
ncbi:MAG: ribonuclease PH [Phycisphaeraceae bacterium]